MDESEVASDDPLDAVRRKLMALYVNANVSPSTIGMTVDAIETAHKAHLGHLAEFWLLLSVGEVLAHPTQTRGHNAAAYRQKALRCADISDEELVRHGNLVDELLPARSDPLGVVRATVAATWAKRPYDALAESLIHTT